MAITYKQRVFPTCYGPEFIAQKVRDWISGVGAKTAYIEPESPWENGYCESYNARYRDELLNGEIFYSLTEAQILIEQWRIHDNTVRPHSTLGYRPPAPPDGGMPGGSVDEDEHRIDHHHAHTGRIQKTEDCKEDRRKDQAGGEQKAVHIDVQRGIDP